MFVSKSSIIKCLGNLESNLFGDRVLSCITIPWRSLTKYGIVKPGFVSEKSVVPDDIEKPNYYYTQLPDDPPKSPEIKNESQITKMKAASRLAKRILDHIGDNIKIGMTTDHIDKMAHNMAIAHLAYPSPLNYKGFPKSICTSVNNVACHGIPDDRPLQDGDIVNVDVTVYLHGHHGDCSATFLVGNVDVSGIKLVNTCHLALEEAIAICRPGEYFCSIANVVEDIARQHNLTVVSCFAGHGIGSYFHGPPDIFHCYNDYPGKMKAGMTFTVEPILSEGSSEVVILEDQWTAVTTDNSRAAQWEHTVLITDNGVQVLTR